MHPSTKPGGRRAHRRAGRGRVFHCFPTRKTGCYPVGKLFGKWMNMDNSQLHAHLISNLQTIWTFFRAKNETRFPSETYADHNHNWEIYSKQMRVEARRMEISLTKRQTNHALWRLGIMIYRYKHQTWIDNAFLQSSEASKSINIMHSMLSGMTTEN